MNLVYIELTFIIYFEKNNLIKRKIKNSKKAGRIEILFVKECGMDDIV